MSCRIISSPLVVRSWSRCEKWKEGSECLTVNIITSYLFLLYTFAVIICIIESTRAVCKLHLLLHLDSSSFFLLSLQIESLYISCIIRHLENAHIMHFALFDVKVLPPTLRSITLFCLLLSLSVLNQCKYRQLCHMSLLLLIMTIDMKMS